MKFNDPFGRMERRHQLGYESLRESLRRGGITTPQAARELIISSRQRAGKIVAVVLALLLLLVVLMPQAFVVAASLALLLVVWVATWMINGRRYIERYIEEDLQKKEPDSRSQD